MTTETAKMIICPDCGGTEFKEGPGGGDATNIECRCGSRFNDIGPFSLERIGQDKKSRPAD